METRVRPDSGTAVLFTADSLLFKEKKQKTKLKKQMDGSLECTLAWTLDPLLLELCKAGF